MLNVKDNTIDFYLAGPGFGECILLVIGKKIMIGVDCCYGIQQPYKSSLSLLEDIFSEIEDEGRLYWILTHFHSDHFQSLYNVIQEFGENFDKIIIPHSYTTADIHYNLQNLSISKKLLISRAHESISSKQYKEVRKILESENIKRKTNRLSGTNILINEVLKTRTKTFSLQVSIYGAFDSDMDRLASNEIKKLMHNTDRMKINRAVANRGSYIIHLKCGSFEALLLGDAPVDRALDILPDKAIHEPVKTFILKVSHHGSKTGTNYELLKKLEPNKEEKYAFLTPFDLNKLPDEEILELLEQHNYKITISGKTKITYKPKDLISEINFFTEGKIDKFIPTKNSIIHREFEA